MRKVSLVTLLGLGASSSAIASVPHQILPLDIPTIYQKPQEQEPPKEKESDAQFIIHYMQKNVAPSENGTYSLRYPLHERQFQVYYIPEGENPLSHTIVLDTLIILDDIGYADFDADLTLDQIILTSPEDTEYHEFPFQHLDAPSRAFVSQGYLDKVHDLRLDMEKKPAYQKEP